MQSFNLAGGKRGQWERFQKQIINYSKKLACKAHNHQNRHAEPTINNFFVHYETLKNGCRKLPADVKCEQAIEELLE